MLSIQIIYLTRFFKEVKSQVNFFNMLFLREDWFLHPLYHAAFPIHGVVEAVNADYCTVYCGSYASTKTLFQDCGWP